MKVIKHTYWLSFFAVGLLLFGIALFSLFGPKHEYQLVKGTITAINEVYNIDTESTDYQVIITYKAEGKTFDNVTYGAYNSGMKVGDRVNVYYDITDPSFFQPEGYEKVPYVVMAGSIITMVFSLLMFIRKTA